MPGLTTIAYELSHEPIDCVPRVWRRGCFYSGLSSHTEVSRRDPLTLRLGSLCTSVSRCLSIPTGILSSHFLLYRCAYYGHSFIWLCNPYILSASAQICAYPGGHQHYTSQCLKFRFPSAMTVLGSSLTSQLRYQSQPIEPTRHASGSTALACNWRWRCAVWPS